MHSKHLTMEKPKSARIKLILSEVYHKIGIGEYKYQTLPLNPTRRLIIQL